MTCYDQNIFQSHILRLRSTLYWWKPIVIPQNVAVNIHNLRFKKIPIKSLLLSKSHFLRVQPNPLLVWWISIKYPPCVFFWEVLFCEARGKILSHVSFYKTIQEARNGRGSDEMIAEWWLQGGAPPVISRFIIPITIDITPITPSFGTYKPT